MRTALARAGDPPRAVEAGEDQRVLSRLAAGDAEAFRGVVARHLPMVLAVSRRMLRDEAEAEDVAQETLLRLWRSAASLELGPGGLRPWLRRVVGNLSIDRIRASRHIAVVDKVPEQAEPAGQLRGLTDRDLAGRVQSALAELPERQRQALVLFHFEGLSQLEVANVLGVSDEAVESLLARGRRALKVALKDEWRDLLPDSDGSE